MYEIVTGCPHDCGGSCPLVAHVEDGEIKRFAPEEGQDSPSQPLLRPCARGLSQIQRVYHAERLRFPLKRVGERGGGKFERITWEEALNTVAGEMRRIKDSYGLQAILNLGGTGNTDGLLHRTGPLTDRFLNSFGGQTSRRSIISFEGAIQACRSSFGLVTPPPGPDSLFQSRLVIMWGLNPSETVFGTNTSYYLALVKEKGTRFIFVDPRFTDSAAALADQWIPVLPGTDTAMLSAMAYVIIKEQLCDEDFINKYTFGFDEFRSYCLGLSDKLPKTPLWAEKICGASAEVITNLAREYATSRPADLRGGWAPGRTAFGEQYHRACIALSAITGNIGIPGGGPGSWVSQNFTGNMAVSSIPPLSNPLGKSIVTWRWADAVLRGISGGYPSDIKMIYSLGGNRLNQCADINKGLKAINKLEFLVVQDQFLTPMARFADIILPASTHFEHDDIQVPHNLGHYLIFNHKVIEPVEGTKSDLEILTELAKKLGISGFNNKSEREWLTEFTKESAVDIATLDTEGVHRFHPSSSGVPLMSFIADPQKNPLPTPSGKIEIFSQALAKKGNPKLSPVPQYIEDWESPGHPSAKKYPLLLITTHTRLRDNSTFDNIPWLRELEPHVALINAVDARVRGIKDGDRIKVYNETGMMVISSKVTQRIMPGVIAIHQGAWYQPDKKGIDFGGSVNVLCKDTISPAEAAATNAVLVQAGRWEA